VALVHRALIQRVQVFAAPGIMLTSVPSLYGTRDLMPATDWGMSFRLFNAGRGSALTAEGTVEMDAAIMKGEQRSAGAVTC